MLPTHRHISFLPLICLSIVPSVAFSYVPLPLIKIKCQYSIHQTSCFYAQTKVSNGELQTDGFGNLAADQGDSLDDMHVRTLERFLLLILDAQTKIDLTPSYTYHMNSCKSWDVYVTKPPNKNKEKGATSSTAIIEAFLSLCPKPDRIKVYPANWKKQNKSKGKGPTVRCVKRKCGDISNLNSKQEILSAFEVTNVDSVDKVYHIITQHMKFDNINPRACECLTCYFEGNERLENGTPSQAITLYNRALSIVHENNKDYLPQGSILMKRSQAYLKRASNHRTLLRLLVKDLSDNVPDTATLQILYQTSCVNPSMAPSIFARLSADSKEHQIKFRSVRYRHDMYEFALLHAVQDSLQATQLLPNNSKAWSLAGECLAKLRKFNESTQYYLKAVELDSGFATEFKEVVEMNKIRMDFMRAGRDGGFSSDMLRLALDVAE